MSWWEVNLTDDRFYAKKRCAQVRQLKISSDLMSSENASRFPARAPNKKWGLAQAKFVNRCSGRWRQICNNRQAKGEKQSQLPCICRYSCGEPVHSPLPLASCSIKDSKWHLLEAKQKNKFRFKKDVFQGSILTSDSEPSSAPLVSLWNKASCFSFHVLACPIMSKQTQMGNTGSS